MAKRSSTHRHRPVRMTQERCFVGCVAGNDCNPASHGGVTYQETCSCGAVRPVNSNQGHREVGAWARRQSRPTHAGHDL